MNLPWRKDGANGATYRVSLTVKLASNAQVVLKASGAKWRHTPEKRMRDFVKMGLKICFADDDQPMPDGGTQSGETGRKVLRVEASRLVGAADKIAGRYGE